MISRRSSRRSRSSSTSSTGRTDALTPGTLSRSAGQLRRGESDAERAPDADRRAHGDRAAEGGHDLAHDREPEPDAGSALELDGLELLERLEDRRLQVLRDPATR